MAPDARRVILAASRGERFAGALARKARRLGQAQAEMRLRARRDDPRRWRLARLLWPLFAKEH